VIKLDIKIKETFNGMMKKLQREKVITFIKSKIENGEVTYKELYQELLIPYLSNWHCDEDIQELCIFKEHVSTSIIRSIIEINYPYIVQNRMKLIEEGTITELRENIMK
jgi:hypothetical protein